MTVLLLSATSLEHDFRGTVFEHPWEGWNRAAMRALLLDAKMELDIRRSKDTCVGARVLESILTTLTFLHLFQYVVWVPRVVASSSHLSIFKKRKKMCACSR